MDVRVLWRKAGWFREELIEAKQQVGHDIPVDCQDGRAGGTASVADQHTRWSSMTKVIVRLVKSHKIGPSDSSHWTPSTISKEPRARP
jgi:hypothetical protein